MKKRFKRKLNVVPTKPNPGYAPIPQNPTERIIQLVTLMASVKTDTEDAKLNATTISDNNGRRINL